MKTNFRITRLTFALLATALFFVRSAAQHPILGTTDITAYLEEVPGLPATLEDAARRAYGKDLLQPDRQALDHFYQPFEDKVNLRIRVYQEFYQKRMQEHQAGASEAAYREQAEKDANRNPIIARMGGIDNVMNMSEEERKAEAARAAAEFVANPHGAAGAPSPGMAALYQKMQSDPAYARKFEKMSEAEKQEELKKYMSVPTSVQRPELTERSGSKANTVPSKADLIRYAQEIQLTVAAFQQRISEVMLEYSRKIDDIQQQAENHRVIGEKIAERFKVIPLVELGEYGRDRDPEQLRSLRVEEARLHRERAREELKQFPAVLFDLTAEYKFIVSDYLDFLKQNSHKIYGGVSVEDMMHGLNTENLLCEFEASLLALAIELSRDSKEMVSKTAVWEIQYVETNQNYRK